MVEHLRGSRLGCLKPGVTAGSEVREEAGVDFDWQMGGPAVGSFEPGEESRHSYVCGYGHGARL